MWSLEISTANLLARSSGFQWCLSPEYTKFKVHFWMIKLHWRFTYIFNRLCVRGQPPLIIAFECKLILRASMPNLVLLCTVFKQNYWFHPWNSLGPGICVCMFMPLTHAWSTPLVIWSIPLIHWNWKWLFY